MGKISRREHVGFPVGGIRTLVFLYPRSLFLHRLYPKSLSSSLCTQPMAPSLSTDLSDSSMQPPSEKSYWRDSSMQPSSSPFPSRSHLRRVVLSRRPRSSDQDSSTRPWNSTLPSSDYFRRVTTFRRPHPSESDSWRKNFNGAFIISLPI